MSSNNSENSENIQNNVNYNHNIADDGEVHNALGQGEQNQNQHFGGDELPRSSDLINVNQTDRMDNMNYYDPENTFKQLAETGVPINGYQNLQALAQINLNRIIWGRRTPLPAVEGIASGIVNALLEERRQNRKVFDIYKVVDKMNKEGMSKLVSLIGQQKLHYAILRAFEYAENGPITASCFNYHRRPLTRYNIASYEQQKPKELPFDPIYVSTMEQMMKAKITDLARKDDYHSAAMSVSEHNEFLTDIADKCIYTDETAIVFAMLMYTQTQPGETAYNDLPCYDLQPVKYLERLAFVNQRHSYNYRGAIMILRDIGLNITGSPMAAPLSRLRDVVIELNRMLTDGAISQQSLDRGVQLFLACLQGHAVNIPPPALGRFKYVAIMKKNTQPNYLNLVSLQASIVFAMQGSYLGAVVTEYLMWPNEKNYRDAAIQRYALPQYNDDVNHLTPLDFLYLSTSNVIHGPLKIDVTDVLSISKQECWFLGVEIYKVKVSFHKQFVKQLPTFPAVKHGISQHNIVQSTESFIPYAKLGVYYYLDFGDYTYKVPEHITFHGGNPIPYNTTLPGYKNLVQSQKLTPPKDNIFGIQPPQEITGGVNYTLRQLNFTSPFGSKLLDNMTYMDYSQDNPLIPMYCLTFSELRCIAPKIGLEDYQRIIADSSKKAYYQLLYELCQIYFNLGISDGTKTPAQTLKILQNEHGYRKGMELYLKLGEISIRQLAGEDQNNKYLKPGDQLSMLQECIKQEPYFDVYYKQVSQYAKIDIWLVYLIFKLAKCLKGNPANTNEIAAVARDIPSAAPFFEFMNPKLDPEKEDNIEPATIEALSADPPQPIAVEGGDQSTIVLVEEGTQQGIIPRGPANFHLIFDQLETVPGSIIDEDNNMRQIQQTKDKLEFTDTYIWYFQDKIFNSQDPKVLLTHQYLAWKQYGKRQLHKVLGVKLYKYAHNITHDNKITMWTSKCKPHSVTTITAYAGDGKPEHWEQVYSPPGRNNYCGLEAILYLLFEEEIPHESGLHQLIYPPGYGSIDKGLDVDAVCWITRKLGINCPIVATLKGKVVYYIPGSTNLGLHLSDGHWYVYTQKPSGKGRTLTDQQRRQLMRDMGTAELLLICEVLQKLTKEQRQRIFAKHPFLIHLVDLQ